MRSHFESRYLWRVVDHEGEVLESFVAKVQDKKAAFKFIKKPMRKPGQLEVTLAGKLAGIGP